MGCGTSRTKFKKARNAQRTKEMEEAYLQSPHIPLRLETGTSTQPIVEIQVPPPLSLHRCAAAIRLHRWAAAIRLHSQLNARHCYWQYLTIARHVFALPSAPERYTNQRGNRQCGALITLFKSARPYMEESATVVD